VTEALELGRASFAGQAWADAFDRLSAADRETPLEPGDLERLAAAAFLVGREDESAEAWARAHHERLARGETGPAARCAFWLALGLLNRGELAAAAAGWPGPGGSWPTARTGPSTATCCGWPRSSRSWRARPRPPWPASSRRPPAAFLAALRAVLAAT
jgi:hypothetical protein